MRKTTPYDQPFARNAIEETLLLNHRWYDSLASKIHLTRMEGPKRPSPYRPKRRPRPY